MHPIVLFPIPLLLSLTTAFQLPNLQPYLPAISFPISISDYIPPTISNTTSDDQRHDLLKRQFSNTCPDNFDSCDNVGAPGLCCVKNAACVADDAGNVACCQEGAVCTGMVNGVITQGTVDGDGNLVSASGGVSSGSTAAAAAGGGGGQVVTSVGSSFVMTGSGSANGGLVAASSPSTIGPAVASSSGGQFIVDGGSTVATPGAAVRRAELVSTNRILVVMAVRGSC